MVSESERLKWLERRWIALNGPFQENGNDGPGQGPGWSIVDRGSSQVVTAVHGVTHARALGKSKENDANTGGLALAVGEAAGVTTAVVLRNDGREDANSDPDHPLKRELSARRLVGRGTTLFDLHGMQDRPGLDIVVGLGPNPESALSLVEQVVSAFEAEGFRVDSDGRSRGLAGARSGTMTSWAQRSGARAVQLEIALRNRTFLVASDRRRRLLSGFLRLLAQVPPVDFELGSVPV